MCYACTYVCITHTRDTHGGQKRRPGLPELDLWAAVKCHVSGRNQTLVFWKSRQCSLLLSHPFRYILKNYVRVSVCVRVWACEYSYQEARRGGQIFWNQGYRTSIVSTRRQTQISARTIYTINSGTISLALQRTTYSWEALVVFGGHLSPTFLCDVQAGPLGLFCVADLLWSPGGLYPLCSHRRCREE